jgi:hypothetical protein
MAQRRIEMMRPACGHGVIRLRSSRARRCGQEPGRSGCSPWRRCGRRTSPGRPDPRRRRA